MSESLLSLCIRTADCLLTKTGLLFGPLLHTAVIHNASPTIRLPVFATAAALPCEQLSISVWLHCALRCCVGCNTKIYLAM